VGQRAGRIAASVNVCGTVVRCRRCRRQREAEREAAARDHMTYFLVDEFTGRNEHWTISANDVLSFARQVAVAMVTVAESRPSLHYHT